VVTEFDTSPLSYDWSASAMRRDRGMNLSVDRRFQLQKSARQ